MHILILISDVECYIDPTGKDYRGYVSQTISGLPCQIWTSQSPHMHLRLPSLYPSAGLGEHNYCRNPDGQSTPWCYTTDSYYRWDYCHIGFPSEDCNLLESGKFCVTLLTSRNFGKILYCPFCWGNSASAHLYFNLCMVVRFKQHSTCFQTERSREEQPFPPN